MKKTKLFLLCTTLICSSILAETSSEIFQETRDGKTEAIKQRINNSEDLSQKDTDGNTVLHIAAEQGYTEMVDALTTEPDYSGWGNWFYGCFYEVKLPNKNTKNKYGKTSLHNSIENGHINTTEKLLSKNADTSIADDEGLKAVFIAAKKDNPNFLPLFLKYKLIEQTINGENMLHYSIRNKKFTMITNLAQNKNLVYQENGHGYTPAMLAATQADIAPLKLLKENGIALNSCNRIGCQPIHATAYAPTTDTAKYLLENGAFVDAADNDGNTPLLHSVIAGNKTGMDFFLAYKADAKKTNTQGKGIVTLAVENKRQEILKRLKDHPDVNINERDNQGMTPFMNATIAQNHSIMKDLIEGGADATLTDNKDENPFHKVARAGNLDGFAIIAKNNPDLLDKVNIDGESPLFDAVKNGHLKMVKTLLYHQVSLQRSNKNGETIFHRAAQCKNKEVLAEVMNNNFTKANITQQANNGLPAIHYAAANNNVETMQEFTKHGASYTDCTKNGDTLAHTAAFYDSTDVVRQLKKQMPMMFEHRNKDNLTPFIIAAKQGNADIINLVFCEKDIMNGDNKTAINLARQNGHQRIASDLKEAENKRTERRVQLSQEPQKVRAVENNIRKWYAKFSDKNPFYLVAYAFHQPAELHYYSVNELLDKTEEECEQISLVYTRHLNQALQEESKLEQEYNRIILAEQAEHLRKERQRITQQQQAQLERQQQILAEQQRQEQAERRRFAAEQEAELKKLNEQNAALKAFNEEDAKLKEMKEQKQELDRIAKEKKAAEAQKISQAQQKAQANPVAAQKAELDYYAQQKAQTDAEERARQAKQAVALEGQHVPADYLQPSAPKMDEQELKCIGCNGKLPKNPSTCKKCKLQCPDICPKCFNKYGGNCLGCYRGKKGEECYANFHNICTETQGVTIIPCDNCKINSDRVCKACLEKSIELNLQKNPPQPHRCPYCTQNTLNQTLKQKIFTQN